MFISEGEEDANRLAGLELVTTTNPGGAGNWHLVGDLTPLQGRKVVILADNDEPGRLHAKQVARSLHTMVTIVKPMNLPGLPDKGDISDWLDDGHTREELLRLPRRPRDLHALPLRSRLSHFVPPLYGSWHAACIITSPRQ